MTSPSIVQPPRPPFGIQVKYRGDQLVVGALWNKWSTPLADVSVQAVDNAGARKRVVTLVFATRSGSTKRHRVAPNVADYTVAWAAAFTAWQQAQSA